MKLGMGAVAALALAAADASKVKLSDRAVDMLGTGSNNENKAVERAEFLKSHGERIAECDKFNRTVNTRQVRRQYARIMVKRK